MSEELKLCPYCGGLVKVAPHQGKAETEKLLMCCTNKRCPNEGNLFYFDEWQSRPLEDALQTKLDECELALDDNRLGRAILEKKLEMAMACVIDYSHSFHNSVALRALERIEKIGG
jgi:hypothetical protein